MHGSQVIGGSDPYAVVWWEEENLGQTEAQSNTCNPTWTDNEFTFAVPPEGGLLRIELFDSDEGVSDDDFLGMLAVHVGGA